MSAQDDLTKLCDEFGIEEAPPRPKCAGPVYYADQGIEVCRAYGGCLCCDHRDVDHSAAEYECFLYDDGRCVLYDHAGRSCHPQPEDKL